MMREGSTNCQSLARHQSDNFFLRPSLSQLVRMVA